MIVGGLLGAVLGPNLAFKTRGLTDARFAGIYLSLSEVALLTMALMEYVSFALAPAKISTTTNNGRPLGRIMGRTVFTVAASVGSLGYGVMNLLTASTPIAVQMCGLPFSDVAWVL